MCQEMFYRPVIRLVITNGCTQGSYDLAVALSLIFDILLAETLHIHHNIAFMGCGEKRIISEGFAANRTLPPYQQRLDNMNIVSDDETKRTFS